MTEERWTVRKARWFARAVDESDYPGAALAALSELLDGCSTVADVGAGTGALTIPLLHNGFTVTAVEPSPVMREQLLARVRAAGLQSRLTMVSDPWEEAVLAPHDLMLFANLPNKVVEGEAFLPRVDRLARRVALIKGARSWDRFWYGELYPLLMGRAWEAGSDYIDLVMHLHAQGVYANVRLFSYTMDQPFDSFEEAVAFWTERLEVGEREPVLREFLRTKLTRRQERWVAAFGLRRAALLWWNAGSETFVAPDWQGAGNPAGRGSRQEDNS